MKITVETTVKSPIAKVWAAYTTPDDIKQWNTASEDWHTTQSTVDLRVGGAFSSRMEAKDGSFGFDFAGTYTRIVPHELIEYSFGDRTGVVEFIAGENGVMVRVTFEAESEHPVEQQRQGWQSILNNFARHVEPGSELSSSEEYKDTGVQQADATSDASLSTTPTLQKITPCLWFNFNAEEAVNHYVSIFKNSKVLEVLRYGDSMPALKGKVLTMRFELEGQQFLALNAGPQHPFTEAISLSVDCADQAEVDALWARLTLGGSESNCSWLKDKFGLSWQIVPRALVAMLSDQDAAKATRVMQAMMTMRKIDIAAIQAAFDSV
jgi:predicted 3-demethylubiquinone-9 3-methyltransferase (glyoxalase superfamily)/uncharacterized protein YndB with AHSA1/START domain